MSGNRAAYIDKIGAPLRVADSEIPKPGPDEVLIKNHAWAVNPADFVMQDTGLFIENWPAVLGLDVAGEVAEVGSSVKKFKKGDRVIGHATSLHTKNERNGGFQHYTIVPAVITAKIPQGLAFKDAVVLPSVVSTATMGMHQPAPFLDLPEPSLSPKDSGKTLLLWGGSSSVGTAVLQLAAASGVKTVATASKHNFNIAKAAGASEVVDYNSDSVVDDVVAAIKKVGGTFVGVYDAISKEPSYKHVLPIIEKLGGNVTLAVVLEPPPADKLPKGVTVGYVYAIHDSTHKTWVNFMEGALEQGSLKSLPPADVVGKGLESLQKGIDLSRKGVSGKKLVVEK